METRARVIEESKHTLLAPAAQDLLPALASEASVERVYSVFGDLTTGKRNRMPETLELGKFLKINSKYLVL
jgi:hypothetical protein